jgi:hypothetical protein
MEKFALWSALLTLLCSCSTIDMSAGHLRNTVPRFTTFTTISPQAIATCVGDHWAASGQTKLTNTQTETGYTLQSTQKLAIDHTKIPMYLVEVNTSREGSSVRFYTNRADEIADRAMVSIIQRCE